MKDYIIENRKNIIKGSAVVAVCTGLIVAAVEVGKRVIEKRNEECEPAYENKREYVVI